MAEFKNRNKSKKKNKKKRGPPTSTPAPPMDLLPLLPLTLSTPLGRPPLVREVTSFTESELDFLKPALSIPSPLKRAKTMLPDDSDSASSSSSDSDSDGDSDTEMIDDCDKMFSVLARWDEKSWQDARCAAPGTWLTYTRQPMFLPKAQYEEAKKRAQAEAKPLDEIVEAMKSKLPARKKTVCRIVGWDDEKERLRVESIPLTGERASTVFPNQTHSWDIPTGWAGKPRFYIVKPEHHPDNKKKKKKAQ